MGLRLRSCMNWEIGVAVLYIMRGCVFGCCWIDEDSIGAGASWWYYVYLFLVSVAISSDVDLFVHVAPLSVTIVLNSTASFDTNDLKFHCMHIWEHFHIGERDIHWSHDPICQLSHSQSSFFFEFLFSEITVSSQMCTWFRIRPPFYTVVITSLHFFIHHKILITLPSFALEQVTTASHLSLKCATLQLPPYSTKNLIQSKLRYSIQEHRNSIYIV